jgi:hypothetical protein
LLTPVGLVHHASESRLGAAAPGECARTLIGDQAGSAPHFRPQETGFALIPSHFLFVKGVFCLLVESTRLTPFENSLNRRYS